MRFQWQGLCRSERGYWELDPRTRAVPTEPLCTRMCLQSSRATTSLKRYSQTSLLQPSLSCGKVMFLHLSVILFTGGRGCLADTHPLGRHTPPGRHPQSDTAPWADTPPRQTRQTATAADGTHPTGMHSCLDSHLTFHDAKMVTCPIVRIFWELHEEKFRVTVFKYFWHDLSE